MPRTPRFRDRYDAGTRLAEHLSSLLDDDVVVLGLPRGGVPVAFEVARSLGAPLDVVLVRKLGVPYQPELAMGAIGEGGVVVVDEDLQRSAGVSDAEIEAIRRREEAELTRRAEAYRGGRRRVPLEGRTVVVVDDGLATGSTAIAACRVARAQGAQGVVLAVPVAPAGSERRVRGDVDRFVALATPLGFSAVGQYYDDFSQTTDEEVVDLLDRAARAAES